MVDESPASQIGVLVVEEHRETLDRLIALLEEKGMTAAGARRRADATKMLEHLRPSLLILNLTRDAAGERAFLRAVRAMPGLGDIRVLAITGDARSTSRAIAMLAGFDAFLMKPVSPEELYSAVDVLVRQAATSSSGIRAAVTPSPGGDTKPGRETRSR